MAFEEVVYTRDEKAIEYIANSTFKLGDSLLMLEILSEKAKIEGGKTKVKYLFG
ncbi:hypothetical protein [Clostridium sp.]|uniref:hypothetical protein n=1 Tax=Clostridium sp. TaxID=1506 RepID=UPI0025BF0440|nr:hypothetical protein [Clostridium sp.]